ncbi:LytTR family transcriptional regulator DNA-binding domain-containing protein [Priestia taiwanensis]|uniref:Transcriptional regulator n=1 Tax=Priestia taiwanensis TaxID=1347902 RepID=A0A917ESJ4_9BACI|nr:LytTR family transcriptional regulator DNA-binding domain-containing protein [Priestia taiwanensis]MBM7364407.1 ABC-2 type transport system ATP-binding protein [Priestia taiwanensis]GGE81655.1 transcriptional regulator [Priestia taiwanensis]
MLLLDVQEVNKIHKNKHLIQDVSFTVDAGECKVLVCNKETGELFINLLFDIDSPTSGTVLFKGERLHPNKHSTYVGVFMLEDGHYERMTVKEFLSFFKDMYRSELSVEKTLEKVGLFDKQKIKLERLTYSELRRLHLARVFIHNPSLVILEEPEQNVDTESVILIRKTIESLRQEKKGILITTFSLETALSITDDVYILNEDGFKRVESEQEVVQEEFVPVEIEEQHEEEEATIAKPIRIDKIPAKVNEKLILFDPMEIYFVESQEGNSYIHVKEGRFLCTYTLNELQEKLKVFGFFRCHRSYIINLQRVREVITWTRNSYSLILDNKEKSSIPLSKGRYDELKEIMGL